MGASGRRFEIMGICSFHVLTADHLSWFQNFLHHMGLRLSISSMQSPDEVNPTLANLHAL